MKKIISFSLLLFVMSAGTAFGQAAVQQNLDNAIQTAQSIPLDVLAAKKAVGQLAKQIAYLGNPDAILFHDKMFA